MIVFFFFFFFSSKPFASCFSVCLQLLPRSQATLAERSGVADLYRSDDVVRSWCTPGGSWALILGLEFERYVFLILRHCFNNNYFIFGPFLTQFQAIHPPHSLCNMRYHEVPPPMYDSSMHDDSMLIGLVLATRCCAG